MRRDDWEAGLNAVIERHRDAQWQWGKTDCWMMAMEAYEAVTGAVLLPKLRGYASEKAGYKLFTKYGFKTMIDVLESVLAPVPVMMAKRGDIALISHNGGLSCGVVTTIGIAVRCLWDDGTFGLQYLPITDARYAFSVD
jgi:hypothetical protein